MTGGDARMVRRAWIMVAVQTVAAVTVLLVGMAVAVLLIDSHQRQAQATVVARNVWVAADSSDDTPGGVWLIKEANGRREVTRGTPHDLEGLSSHAFPDGASTTTWHGRDLSIWTGDKENVGRVSAVYDMTVLNADGLRLRKSLALGVLLGVAGAAVLGIVIGRRAVRPLGDALAVQRRFVADASHELRTPLTVLLTRAQLMRRRLSAVGSEGSGSAGSGSAGSGSEGSVEAEMLREVDHLVADARVLSDVVSDLLVSAEMAQRLQDGPPVDVGALAQEVGRSMEQLATDREIHLSTVVGEAGTATVRGASAALRRAVTALTDNAVAHTPPGGHVTLRVTSDAAHVTLTVVDDGEGLDPEQAPRLVERFARGTTQDAGRRFGLGLALVDEVARSHGGTLQIGGKLGEGATFALRLPQAS